MKRKTLKKIPLENLCEIKPHTFHELTKIDFLYVTELYHHLASNHSSFPSQNCTTKFRQVTPWSGAVRWRWNMKKYCGGKCLKYISTAMQDRPIVTMHRNRKSYALDRTSVTFGDLE